MSTWTLADCKQVPHRLSAPVHRPRKARLHPQGGHLPVRRQVQVAEEHHHPKSREAFVLKVDVSQFSEGRGTLLTYPAATAASATAAIAGITAASS